ncbi:MAG: histidine phosphatase family protein [Chloroflexota bacterium]|nr:histidine phosphatase family protein [Chloroflexota bacterium]
MARFILVRHGQTGWNREERFRGRVDIDLDEMGMRQAEAVAERLAGCDATAVYSSPLKRAVSTAGAIGRRLGLEVTPLESIVDMDFGEWEGRSVAEVREREAGQFRVWALNPESFRVPGGETLDEVRVRVAAAVDELAAEHQDDAVVLVSHRVVCKVLLCHLLGLDMSHFWQIAQDTTAVNGFLIAAGRSTVTLVNDTCHLRAL